MTEAEPGGRAERLHRPPAMKKIDTAQEGERLDGPPAMEKG
jgi:hypothetical protein